MIKIFLSYSRDDDVDGEISRIRDRFLAELKIRQVESIIEMDVDKQMKGDWLVYLGQTIDESDFFFAFFSPRYIRQEAHSRREFLQFLKRESAIGRQNQRLIIFNYIPTQSDEYCADDVLFAEYKRRDIQDWSMLRTASYEASDYRLKVSRLVDYIVTESAKSRATLGAEAHGAIVEKLLTDIKEQSFTSVRHNAFRLPLIANVLGSVLQEVRQLNSTDDYGHNLSLDSSFMVRAEAIFHAAQAVYAVSVDTYSSFWISDAQKDRAIKYTELQPPSTRRLFVFSSPESMLRYRWVLATHYDRYGKNEDGRVLFTDRESWESLIRGYEGRPGIESNWLADHLQRDFGVMLYTDRETSYYEATLDESRLSFREIRPNPFHEDMMIRFRSEDDGLGIPFVDQRDQKRFLWVWRPDYGLNKELWHEAVERTFAGQSSKEVGLRDQVFHIVLFSSELSASLFKEIMLQVLPKLRDIKKASSGEPLIENIWFGTLESLHRTLEKRRDGVYGFTLRLQNEMSRSWPHCLFMTFASERDLEEYYGHLAHGYVREDIYSRFNEAIRVMYGHLRGIDADENRVVQVIEELAAKYMLRMDFARPEKSATFDIVSAVPFGGLGAD